MKTKKMYEGALEYAQLSLGVRQEISGTKPHPDVAASLNSIAVILVSLNRKKEALEYAKKALKMKQELYEYSSDLVGKASIKDTERLIAHIEQKGCLLCPLNWFAMHRF
jgi:tetratricopeptide (TPR) repeat protein